MFKEIHSETDESFPTLMIPPLGLKTKMAKLPKVHPIAAQPHLTSILNRVILLVKKKLN
jgi:hypothetical protein